MAKKKRPIKENKDYELIACNRKHDHRILSLDPGSRNMGIACVGVKNQKIDVVANSIMQRPIASLVEKFTTHREAFIYEVECWLELYEPQLIIMERFQTRGNMGPLIELVSTMNAVVTMIDRNIPCKLITAGTWKNSFHRRFIDVELNDLYKDCLTTSHQLDATLIGCYGLEVAMQTELAYSPVSIIEMVETTSCLPLRKKRS